MEVTLLKAHIFSGLSKNVSQMNIYHFFNSPETLGLWYYAVSDVRFGLTFFKILEKM